MEVNGRRKARDIGIRKRERRDRNAEAAEDG